MDISFICVNYYSADLVQKLFGSLIPLLQDEPLSYECIIIDQSNDSKETDMLKKIGIPCSTITQHPNKGFGAGMNFGTSLAKGKYLFFLNPDMEFIKFDWHQTERFLSAKGGDFFAGGRLFLPNGSLQVSTWWFPSVFTETLRRIANRLSEKGCRLWNKLLNRYSQKPRAVPWVTGALLLIPRHIFLSLGGFDENFFLFFEDIDLCYRARKKEVAGYWVPYIEAVHLESVLTKKNRKKALKWYRQSRRYFWQKHYSKISGIILQAAQKISDFPLWR